MPLVSIRDFSYTWPEADRPALDTLNLDLNKGQVTICAGGNGAGKSSMALALAGIIPHKTGGRLGGSVIIKGADSRHSSPLEISKIIGISFQQPQGQFFTLSLEEEIAFSLEQRAMEPEDIRRRVKEVLAFTGLSGMENRSPQELSGGEMQRASLAILLAYRPELYILDEPFAALDPLGRKSMEELLKRLVVEEQASVLIFTKDPLPLLSIADQLLLLEEGKIHKTIAKPIEQKCLDLDPFSVHRSQLYELGRLLRQHDLIPEDLLSLTQAKKQLNAIEFPASPSGINSEKKSDSKSLLSLENISFSYDATQKLIHDLSLEVKEGELLWLIGENGSGKSTLFKLIMGLLKAEKGKMTLQGEDIANSGLEGRAGVMGLALQNPDLQLFSHSVCDELSFGPKNLGWSSESIQESMEGWVNFFQLEGILNESPMMQTFSLRKWIALASVVVMDPMIYLLDEPDWTLDRHGRDLLARFIAVERARGKAFIVISHNQEYMAEQGGEFLLLQKDQPWQTGPMEELFYQGPWQNYLELAQLPQAMENRSLSPHRLAASITGEKSHG